MAPKMLPRRVLTCPDCEHQYTLPPGRSSGSHPRCDAVQQAARTLVADDLLKLTTDMCIRVGNHADSATVLSYCEQLRKLSERYEGAAIARGRARGETWASLGAHLQLSANRIRKRWPADRLRRLVPLPRRRSSRTTTFTRQERPAADPGDTETAPTSPGITFPRLCLASAPPNMRRHPSPIPRHTTNDTALDSPLPQEAASEHPTAVTHTVCPAASSSPLRPEPRLRVHKTTLHQSTLSNCPLRPTTDNTTPHCQPPRPGNPPREETMQTNPCPPGPPVPADFQAFYALHQPRYLAYARAHLQPHDADPIVRATFTRALVRWAAILLDAAPATVCWRMLTARIDTHPLLLSPRAQSPLQYQAVVLHHIVGSPLSVIAETTGEDLHTIRYMLSSWTT
ncbi:hypothetical protein ABT354_30795 [Streptomyces sp. NPDC000594]|uniref:hypothetical protein n=1 Tax=Streptomyces sp. NPDC000594 TaxID=3154261 RepID=UPI0033225C3E